MSMRVKQSIKLLSTLLLTAGCASTALAGPLLYIDDDAGRLGTIDVESGAVNVIGNTGQTLTDIAFDKSGNLFGISFSQLFSIDKTTAAATLIGSFGNGIILNSLVFGADNTLYAANTGLYRLNTANGFASPITNGSVNTVPYNSSGDLAFVAGNLFLSSSVGNDSLVKVDTASGVGSAVGSIGYANVFGLTSNDNINLFGTAGTEIIKISTSTGLGTAVLNYAGKGLSAANGSAFFAEAGARPPVTEIAEPTSIALFGMGLLACIATRRKFKK